MKIKEKIKKIYQKYDVNINEDYMQGIMDNPQRVDSLIRMYKEEEINSMNEIFDKPYDNKYFTEFELKAVQNIDLFDRKVIGICKIIWKNRNNKKKLESFLKQLEEREVIV